MLNELPWSFCAAAGRYLFYTGRISQELGGGVYFDFCFHSFGICCVCTQQTENM